MYTIFINDHSLKICNEATAQSLKSDSITLSDTDVPSILKWIHSSTNAVVVNTDPVLMLRRMMATFPVIRAAGGIVIKPDHEILAIRRHGIWDLPKGKCEPMESCSETALREVAEECQPGVLTLDSFAGISYHMYQIEQRWVLKENWWFTINCPQPATAVPQSEEGIEEVRWCNRKELSQVMVSGHASIQNLLRDLNYIN